MKNNRQNLKSYERLKSKKTQQSVGVQAQDSDSMSNCGDEMIEPEVDSSEARQDEGQRNQVDDITVTTEKIHLLLSTQGATLRDKNSKLTTILKGELK